MTAGRGELNSQALIGYCGDAVPSLPRETLGLLPYAAALHLHALDVRAEAVELLVDELIAAVDVIDTVDFGGAFAVQAGEDERGAGAQVAGHDGRAAQAR